MLQKFTPLFFILLLGSNAFAQYQGLNYARRTRPYAGWTSIIKGDNNTVGMGGATIAIPNSIAAMEGNAAGFAMDLSGLGAQINSNNLKDARTEHGNPNITEFQGGLGTSAPPWGYGLTYYSPSTEFADANEVSVRELRLSLARLIGSNISVGASLQYTKAIRKFGDVDFNSGTLAFQLGGLYKLNEKWVLGASFSPSADIGPGSSDEANPFGFNQTLKLPSLTSVGIGFLPNRFFKAGASLILVGSLRDTGTLWDENVNYGQKVTLQPRLGASYILIEYLNFKAELAMGTYYEVSRIEGLSNRLHGTFGLDINPWFINTGIGTDLASGYRNWVASVGVDLVRTARFFGIIPLDTIPPYNGVFPHALVQSPDGLPDGFTIGQEKSVSPPSAADVKNIVTGIPAKFVEKFGTPEQVAESQKGKLTNAKEDAKDRHLRRKKKPAKIFKALKPAEKRI